jgi:hypothetical protein
MNVQQRGSYYIQVSQKDERCFSRHEDYEYSSCRFILAQILEDGEYFYLGGKIGQERDIWREYADLEVGEYYVFLEMDWNQNDKVDLNDFVVSSYGVNNCFFIKDEAFQIQKTDFLSAIYISSALQEGSTAKK